MNANGAGPYSLITDNMSAIAGVWYRSQKEHCLGWLGEDGGAGAYGRSAQTARNARYVYNHIQCAPILFWLPEALGMKTERLDAAFGAVTCLEVKGVPQCAAFRQELPLEEIESGLTDWP